MRTRPRRLFPSRLAAASPGLAHAGLTVEGTFSALSASTLVGNWPYLTGRKSCSSTRPK